jgi:hypothetical protein
VKISGTWLSRLCDQTPRVSEGKGEGAIVDDSETTPILPASWPQMLDKVRRTLRKAEAAARQREADPVLAGESVETNGDDLARRLAALADVLKKRQKPMEETKKLAAETDSLLAGVQSQFEKWLKAVRKSAKPPRESAVRRR